MRRIQSRRVGRLGEHFARSIGLLSLVIGSCYSQQYVISTLAGGVPPPTPALATTDSIYPPAGVTSDSDGNILFTSGNCIFRLDQHGILTLLAGNSMAGYSGDGGPAANAQLNNPTGITVDGAGNIFVAESGRVRRISATGIITTVAGVGKPQLFSDGGPAIKTALASPVALAFDASGNLFVVDSGFARILKISPNGILSTIAGGGNSVPGDNGLATAAQLNTPTSLAIDQAGNLFVGDAGNHNIRKISVDGTITTVAGTGVEGASGDGGPATRAQVSEPNGLAFDADGNLFIADSGRYLVRVIGRDGIITTVAGQGTIFPGEGTLARNVSLFTPSSVTVAKDGNLYLAAGWIQRIQTDGKISIVSGNGTYSNAGDGGLAKQAQFYRPGDVAVDSSGNVFIADVGNNLVRKIDSNGIITTVAGSSTRPDNCGFSGDGGLATNALLCAPTDVAVDASGNLYISDSLSNHVRKVTPNGIITTVVGNGAGAYSGDGGSAIRASLYSPGGLAIDRFGNLFIADRGNDRVRRVSPDGIISTVAGNGTYGFSGDGGPATDAQLYGPAAIAVDGAGNLFISDAVNGRIRKVSADGTISTVAGDGSFKNLGDGESATNVSLFNSGAGGLAVDGGGNIFLADGLDRIRMISTSNAITTIAGAGGFGQSTDHMPALMVSFKGASGLAVDGDGRIYLAEASGRIDLLQPTDQSVLIGSLGDAATGLPSSISPGKIVVINGAGLGPAQSVSNKPINGVFSTSIAGTGVTVNGIPAPILSVSPTAVSAIIPYAVTGPVAKLAVTYQGQTSPGLSVDVADSSPSIFSSNGNTAGQAAAVNADGLLNDAAHPVMSGGYLSLYVTGEGDTIPAGVDGKIAALSGPLPQPILAVKVTIDGQQAVVIYAGAAPGEVSGVMQVVVQIPPNVRSGGYVPVVLQVGDVSTVQGATWIAISGN